MKQFSPSFSYQSNQNLLRTSLFSALLLWTLLRLPVFSEAQSLPGSVRALLCGSLRLLLAYGGAVLLLLALLPKNTFRAPRDLPNPLLPWPFRWLLSAAVWLLLLLFGFLIGIRFPPSSGGSLSLSSPLSASLAGLRYVVLPALLEEWYFRSLQSALWWKILAGQNQTRRKAGTIAVPALLFTLMHASISGMLTALPAGMLLGWLALRSIRPGQTCAGCPWETIAVHLLYNLAALLLS